MRRENAELICRQGRSRVQIRPTSHSRRSVNEKFRKKKRSGKEEMISNEGKVKLKLEAPGAVSPSFYTPPLSNSTSMLLI